MQSVIIDSTLKSVIIDYGIVQYLVATDSEP